MRVLYLFCDEFRLEPFRKGHADAVAEERHVDIDVQNAVVCLVHSEDEDDGKIVTKLIKHAKWVAKKFESKTIVLHFFAHLGENSGDADRALELLQTAQERLLAVDYDCRLTPFGYFCRLDFKVHGESLAKIFKRF